MNSIKFKQAHKEARSLSHLARLVECTPQTARRWCKKLGLEVKLGTVGRLKVYDDAAFQKAHREAEGNVAGIARLVGCSYLTALMRTKKLDLKPKGIAGQRHPSINAKRMYAAYRGPITIRDLSEKYEVDSRTIKAVLMREYRKHPLSNGHVRNVKDIKLAKAIHDEPEILEMTRNAKVKRLIDLTEMKRLWVTKYLNRRSRER